MFQQFTTLPAQFSGVTARRCGASLSASPAGLTLQSRHLGRDLPGHFVTNCGDLANQAAISGAARAALCADDDKRGARGGRRDVALRGRSDGAHRPPERRPNRGGR